MLRTYLICVNIALVQIVQIIHLSADETSSRWSSLLFSQILTFWVTDERKFRKV